MNCKARGQLWGHLSESDLLFIIVINTLWIVFGRRLGPRFPIFPGIAQPIKQRTGRRTGRRPESCRPLPGHRRTAPAFLRVAINGSACGGLLRAIFSQTALSWRKRAGRTLCRRNLICLLPHAGETWAKVYPAPDLMGFLPDGETWGATRGTLRCPERVRFAIKVSAIVQLNFGWMTTDKLCAPNTTTGSRTAFCATRCISVRQERRSSLDRILEARLVGLCSTRAAMWLGWSLPN
jgi:hypothetical protein